MQINNYEKAIIIYHDRARGGKSSTRFNSTLKKIKQEGLFRELKVFNSPSLEETEKVVREVHEQKSHDLIISYGGDGTISSVCNSLMKIDEFTRLPLLPLPGGSGNSFIKDFGINNIDEALLQFKKGETTTIDVVKVEELEGDFSCYCINVLGMGFISDIANYAVEHGKKYGSLSYVLGATLGLKNFKPYKTKVIIDGKESFQSDKVFFLTISNSMYTGGSIKIAPDASYNDGLMDMIILHDINRFEFVKGFLGAFKGGHTKQRGCKYIQAKEIIIEATPAFSLMPDGDLAGSSPIRVTNIPRQIRLAL